LRTSLIGLVVTGVFYSTSAWAQQVPDSVYPPPEPGESFAEPDRDAGGVHFGLDVLYLTDNVWRGIERFDSFGSEDQLNLQIHSKLRFDLGKLPSPFVSLQVNMAENDPVSSFQEVRPTVGFDWNVRPLTITAGHFSYLFPDREDVDTGEVFLTLRLDDSTLFRAERPVFHPYVMAAYDYDLWEGLYIEAGIRHELPIENTGLVLGASANVSYVNGHGLFAVAPDDKDTGFQAWQVGVDVRYRLNKLMNIPDRFGQWSVTGFINYTDNIDQDLLATDQLWGGAGLSFEF
jgi:hypothetical protein